MIKEPTSKGFQWRFAFLMGLLTVPLVFYAVYGYEIEFNSKTYTFFNKYSDQSEYNIYVWITGGLLVGFGTRMAKGCTLGHSINGIPSLSTRSFIATCTFLLTGLLMANTVLEDYSNVLEKNCFIDSKDGKPEKKYPMYGLGAFGLMMAFFVVLLVLKARHEGIHEYIETYFFGLLLGAGLMISGLCNRTTVWSFLILNKDKWNPTLGLIFFIAIVINFITYSHILSGNPMFGSGFKLPKQTGVDFKLLIGSGIFGLGWGLTQLDPATGIINMFLSYHIAIWFLAFVFGQCVYHYTSRYLHKKYHNCESEESLL